MLRFAFDAPSSRVVFGADASREQLAGEVERIGGRRVLLIAAERELELADELVARFADRVAATFTEVRPHVPVEVADRARKLAGEAGVDLLLCIGGGSTTGTAKAVALETGLPILAVPTTYAGSEMTPIWGMTEGSRKSTGTSARVVPKVVVYDPELTRSLPPHVTGPSAMNAMAHCVEAFYAPGANPISSLVAEEGIRALTRGVTVAVREPADRTGRSDTLYGAYLAGAALAVAGAALHHKICHVLGGAFDLPHAELHTIVLPHAVAFNEPALPEVMARVATAAGRPGGSAAAALFELAERIGAPTRLSDIGLSEDDLDVATALVLEGVPADNPRPIDEAGIRGLLSDAVAGRKPATDVRSAQTHEEEEHQ